MRTTIAIFGAMLGLVATAPTAQSAFIYQFAIAGNPTAANSVIDVVEGNSLTVDVYLYETGSSILSTNGLLNTGVKINFSNALASVVSENDITGNTSYAPPIIKQVGSGFALVEGNAPITGFNFSTGEFTFGTVKSADGRQLVGSFVITTALNSLGTLAITTSASDAIPTVSYLDGVDGTTGNQVPLDSSITQDTLNINVVAVPEPTSLALLGVGAFGLIARRIRGRKTVEAVAAA